MGVQQSAVWTQQSRSGPKGTSKGEHKMCQSWGLSAANAGVIDDQVAFSLH